MIAAATSLQEAAQPKAGNGALVATLLEALTEAGRANGTALMREVVRHIKNRLPVVSAEVGLRHTPIVVEIGLDFPIARNKPH